MKKTLTFLIFLTSALLSVAQSHIQWTTPEITPGMQVNLLKATNTDKYGNTYTIHFTQEPVQHYMTYRFFRYDTQGVKQWQYDNDSCFTGCQDIYSIIVPVDNDGAIFIGYHDDLSGQWQIRIKRIGLNGNLLWQNYWNIPYIAGYPVTARLDHAGNLVMALKAITSMPNDNDFAFAKFNVLNGNLIWHYELPDVGAATGWHQEDVRSMDIDAADAIYGCGMGGFDNYYFKVTSAGALDYQFKIHDNDSIHDILNTTGVIQVQVGSNNDFYLLIGAGMQTWVQKYEAGSGDFLFSKIIQHDSATTVPVALAVGNVHIYALNNYYYSFPDTTFSGIHYTNNDYMITDLDTGGTTAWEKSFLENLDTTFTFNVSSGATAMLLCNANLYVMSTYLSDSATFSQSLALHKIDPAGNSAWFDTSASPGEGGMAADSSCNIYISRPAFIFNGVHVVTQKYSDQLVDVQQINNDDAEWTVFPNPAQDVIRFSSAIKNNFEVEVINATGEIMLSGKSQHQLNVSWLAPGIYLIKIQDEKQVAVKKFIKE
jgi:hypothetical protein